MRADSGIRSLADLAGRTIGVPEWAQTAGIYGRGILSESAGVALDGVHWVQAGLHQPRRAEKVKLALPPGAAVRAEPQRTLDEMLVAGEIDCAMTAAAPRAFLHPDAVRIVRLLPDCASGEEAWYRATGVYPIMHAVAIRIELLERHPWLAMNLYRAFDEARRRSMARMDSIGVSAVPMAWMAAACERMRTLFGEDWFPYGIGPNRTTLEALCRYCHQQGIAQRLLRSEDLFAKSVQTSVTV